MNYKGWNEKQILLNSLLEEAVDKLKPYASNSLISIQDITIEVNKWTDYNVSSCKVGRSLREMGYVGVRGSKKRYITVFEVKAR